MIIQPGNGYGYSSSGYGASLDLSNPFPDTGITAPLCPFTIYFTGTFTPGGGSLQYRFSAVPGHVNNLIPILGTGIDPAQRLNLGPVPIPFNFDAEGNSFIYLKVSNNDPDYPVMDPTDILYPRIISSSVSQPDTEDSGFMLLANVTKNTTTNVITIIQLTCGSIWTVRFKCGDDPPQYWWSAV